MSLCGVLRGIMGSPGTCRRARGDEQVWSLNPAKVGWRSAASPGGSGALQIRWYQSEVRIDSPDVVLKIKNFMNILKSFVKT